MFFQLTKKYSRNFAPMKYQEDLDIAKENKADNKRLGKQMRRTPERKLDELFHNHHEKVFQEIDCLECANCCKTTSPIFRDVDVKRLAKRFRMKPIQFIEEYLRVDEDDDYVLKSSPCPFLFRSEERRVGKECRSWW